MIKNTEVKKQLKVNKIKKNIFLFLCIFSLSLTSVAYSAFRSSREIASISKIFNADEEKVLIRSVANVNGCGYEIYDFEKTDESLTVNIELPDLECSVFYEIELENNTDSPMQLIDITDKFNVNENIMFTTLGFEKEYFLLAHETTTMMIEVKYDPSVTKMPEDISYNAIIEFVWEKIDISDLVARITYSEVNFTGGSVIANLNFIDKNITIINNNNSNEYVFNENGEFTFEYMDPYSKIHTIEASVNWIDKELEEEIE